MDNAQFQVDELEVIQSAYPKSTTQDHGLVDFVAMVVASKIDPEAARLELQQKPCVSFYVSLCEDNLHVGIEFPKSYPESSLKVSVRGFNRSKEDELLISLRRIATNAAVLGEGCAFEVIQAAETYALEISSEVLAETPVLLPSKPVCVCRRLIYSHHIIATDKRVAITANALELRLGGFVKHGWPGIIVVEGLEGNVEEYYRRLKRFQWKHLEVRGEEVEEICASVQDESCVTTASENDLVAKFCRLPRAFEELGDSGDALSAVGRRCREAGLEDLFASFFGKKVGAVRTAEGVE